MKISGIRCIEPIINKSFWQKEHYIGDIECIENKINGENINRFSTNDYLVYFSLKCLDGDIMAWAYENHNSLMCSRNNFEICAKYSAGKGMYVLDRGIYYQRPNIEKKLYKRRQYEKGEYLMFIDRSNNRYWKEIEISKEMVEEMRILCEKVIGILVEEPSESEQIAL